MQWTSGIENRVKKKKVLFDRPMHMENNKQQRYQLQQQQQQSYLFTARIEFFKSNPIWLLFVNVCDVCDV